MELINNFSEKKIAVIGFGLEGRDVAIYLQRNGLKYSVFDRKDKRELDLSGLDTRGVDFYCGRYYDLTHLVNYEMIVRSPGVYRYLPEILDAQKAGANVTSGLNMFFEQCPSRIIGVTGTKGKGTTTTLIWKILSKSGTNTFLAGNIGKPYLELLHKLKKSDWVVLELSSFQLIDLAKSPHIAVVLNVTTDHLDWHKDRKEYLDAKKNILVHQRSGDFAVVNYDYPEVRRFAKLGSGKKFFFSKGQKVSGAYVKSGKIYLGESEIGDTQQLLLRGRHNWENITAAICAARLAKATLSSIKQVVYSFKGLEHRLELVRKLGGIGFYNDSFSTNPQTTIAAINSFTEPITVILGGFEKNLDYDEMAVNITKVRVKNCILIGDISAKIKRSLIKAKYRGLIIEMGKSPMSVIVKKCYEVAGADGVVLLSPASSSFDMFPNYKERGWQFKKAVGNLV